MSDSDDDNAVAVNAINDAVRESIQSAGAMSLIAHRPAIGGGHDLVKGVVNSGLESLCGRFAPLEVPSVGIAEILAGGGQKTMLTIRGYSSVSRFSNFVPRNRLDESRVELARATLDLGPPSVVEWSGIFWFERGDQCVDKLNTIHLRQCDRRLKHMIQ